MIGEDKNSRKRKNTAFNRNFLSINLFNLMASVSRLEALFLDVRGLSFSSERGGVMKKLGVTEFFHEK